MSSATIKKQAISGTAWTILGYGTSQSLRLGSNLILTRLLVPELFGLMALVSVFLMGLNLFSDVGIYPSIIQNKRGEDPVFLNTAWTVQVIRGFALWIGCLLIAFPVAQFYEEPRLQLLLPIVGLNSIINGFNSTNLPILQRRMEIGKLIRFELGIQIISLIVMITWAWFSPSIWALVVGNLVSTTVEMIWSHRLLKNSVQSFAWDREVVKELTSFGKWIFISTAMTFLASEIDRLMLGKLFSLEMLSFYIIAFTFADIPRQIVSKLSFQVLYPVIVKYASLPRKVLKEKMMKPRWIMLLGQAIALTMLISFGDYLITILYDARYVQATWILPILALGLWPLMLSITSDKALLAIGSPNYAAWGNLWKFIYMAIALPLGFHFYGILGAVIVIAFNDLPFYGLISYGLCCEKLSTVRQDIEATLILMALLGAVLAIRYNIGLGLPIDAIL
ncbi:oligosaccharide flippase family protein [Waterburya agarophytonicola K14]|uniref:Oligosaccharide flippase family protein n=1 Tax=Waterburya agarophytonicola KI4 TaxID=2874699 RepID=A0A964FEP9_9CYAN|nr:oligosaccharide flippase family protein [Waterburya agarophytonicola]MCC0176142.1 oligosaccharide flippase family protein [Waterburya agarophytonicola KI4]